MNTMQAAPEWIEQLAMEPCRCYRCKKKIQPLMVYWRRAQSQDSSDEFGNDFCEICKDALVSEEAK